ncbi:prominin-2 isoform 2-T2 [Discoglossus pictus]
MGYHFFTRGSWDCIIFLVLFVLLYDVGQVTCQKCASRTNTEVLQFNRVQSNSTTSTRERNWGALSPLFNMVGIFLDAVQPNPFPKDLLRVLLTNASSVQSSEVVKYEAGYVTCAVIAVLYLIFMVVFGIIFCTYEYRGRRVLGSCDGLFCQKTPIFICLLLTCLILLAGLVLTFYLNQKVKEEVGPGVKDMRSTLQNFQDSVSGIPQALQKVVSEFNVPKEKVFNELDKFGSALNYSVSSKLNEEVFPRLQKALQTAKQLEAASQIVVDLNMTLVSLQEGYNKLASELSTHKENLQKIFSDQRCENCNEAAAFLQRVQLGLNYSQIPSLNDFMTSLTNVRKINLSGLFEQGIKSFNNAPKLVSTQTSKSIDEVRNALNNAQQEIQYYSNSVPITRYTEPINKALENIELKTVKYGQDLERYEYYRWILGYVLSCVLLLIVLCTLLGLLIGVWALYAKQDPEDEQFRRRAGSGLLIVDVYLSFTFSWLLVIFVFVTFVIGGNVQTLLCRHWANDDIYKFLDEPGNLPQNIDLKRQIGLKENSNFTDMYRQCKKGAPFWDVLQFNNPIDLDNTFNISKYTGDIQNKIDNFTVEIGGLSFFTRIAVLVLLDYNNSGIDQVPFNSILSQIQTPLLSTDLGQVVTALGQLAAIQSDVAIQNDLVTEADALRNLQDSLLREQEADVANLNTSLQSLAKIAPTLVAGIDQAIKDVEDLKGPIFQDIIRLIKNESSCLVKQAIEYFTQYLEWVKRTITEDISSCRSVSLTLDNARVIVCNNVTDPWNGFWFCLGWCTFLLIPMIFFSIKAAEHISPLTLRSRVYTLEEEDLCAKPQEPEPMDVLYHELKPIKKRGS